MGGFFVRVVTPSDPTAATGYADAFSYYMSSNTCSTFSSTPQAHSTLLGDRRYKRKTHDEYIEHDIQYHRVFLRAVKCMELVVKMPVSRDEVSSFVKVLPSIIAHGNFKKALNDFFLATKGPTTGDGLYRRRIISLCTVVLNLLDQADPLPYMQGQKVC